MSWYQYHLRLLIVKSRQTTAQHPCIGILQPMRHWYCTHPLQTLCLIHWKMVPLICLYSGNNRSLCLYSILPKNKDGRVIFRSNWNVATIKHSTILVWPDAEIKKLPNFPQYYPKSSQIIFTWKLYFLKLPKILL